MSVAIVQNLAGAEDVEVRPLDGDILRRRLSVRIPILPHLHEVPATLLIVRDVRTEPAR